MALTKVKGVVWDGADNGLAASVVDFGAVGDNVTDDTTALQAAIDTFKNPTFTDNPAAASWQLHEFQGRVLDLGGLHYKITSPLNFDNAYGMTFQNGVLIASGGGFATDRAVIEGDICPGIVLQEITVECNEVANGILANRWVYGTIRNVRVFGCGPREYGIKSATTFGGLALKIEGCRIAGPIGSSTATPAVNPTCTGILIEGGSDSKLHHCEITRCLVGMDIQSGGWQITANHYTGYANSAGTGVHSVGLKMASNQRNTVSDSYFNNCYLYLVGTGRWLITDNFFNSNVDEQGEYAILWEASTAQEPMAQAMIVNNHVDLRGTEANFDFIRLSEPSTFTWGDMVSTIVGDNIVNGNSAATDLINPRSTYGTLVIDVEDPTDWTGTVTVVDLTDHILNSEPDTATPEFNIDGFSVRSSPNADAYLQDYSYNHANGKLSLEFNVTFAGVVTISYRYGDQFKRLAAQAS